MRWQVSPSIIRNEPQSRACDACDSRNSCGHGILLRGDGERTMGKMHDNDRGKPGKPEHPGISIKLNTRAIDLYVLGLRLQQAVLTQRAVERRYHTTLEAMAALDRLKISFRSCLQYPPIEDQMIRGEGVLQAVLQGLVAAINRPTWIANNTEFSRELTGFADSCSLSIGPDGFETGYDLSWFQLGWHVGRIYSDPPKSLKSFAPRSNRSPKIDERPETRSNWQWPKECAALLDRLGVAKRQIFPEDADSRSVAEFEETLIESDHAPAWVVLEVGLSQLRQLISTRAPRRKYVRDALFLAWFENESEEGYGSIAAIRDRWNRENRHDKVNYEVVKKGLAKAKRERSQSNLPISIPSTAR